GTVEAGRLVHEHHLVEILSKARTAGVGAESVRTLGRRTSSVIRRFLKDHGAADDAFPEDAWTRILTKAAHRCHSAKDVRQEAREIAQAKFPKLCAALAREYFGTMPLGFPEERAGIMLEHFVYRDLTEWKRRKASAHSSRPR